MTSRTACDHMLVLAMLGAVASCKDPVPAKRFVDDTPAPVVGTCDLPTNKPAFAGAGAVYSGTRRPSLVPMNASQQDAVVGISDDVTIDDFGTFCSGTLITPTVVLTAQHCTTGYTGDQMLVVFGADEFAPTLVVKSVEVVEHPTLDIAMIVLAQDPTAMLDVTPVPVAFHAPRFDQVGSLVENAGYGDTDDGSEGRYFVTELYRGIYQGQWLQVDGEGTRGVCFGDSGGPSLMVSDTGDVRVLGVLNFGDDPCGSTDYYQRVDTVLDFVESRTGPTPPGTIQACGADITAAGSCNSEQTVATYCDGQHVVRDVCDAEQICAPNTDGARRCVAVADNPCGDVTAFGGCDNNTLTWCRGDAVVTRDCGACAEACLLIDDNVGYGCVPSSCGDVDLVGECRGDVATWCESDVTLQTEDCAASGQTCGYIGADLGYYCYDAEACDGYDYYGACEGSVLHWCENNTPMSIDCADDGTTCTLVDEDTGYNCQ